MLDPLTVSVMTAVVVIAAGVVFVLETLLRKDEGAGRVWALAFLAGMLTTLSYLVWAASPATWWAVAIGNAAFVAGTGCLYLGCRRFNGREMLWPSLAVMVGSLSALVAVVVAGPRAGAWAGAATMFIALAIFAAAGTVESLQGEMRRNRNSVGLAVVLGVQAVYYVARTGVFLVAGPESDLFNTWFGTITTSVLTVILTIVAVVTTSVLRAGRAQLRGRSAVLQLSVSSDGLLESGAFIRVLTERVQRAQALDELIGVVSVRLDDIPQIATAFGTTEAQHVQLAWRDATRRFSPTSAIIGDDGSGGLAIGIHPASAADARRMAERVNTGVGDALGALGASVIPVVGVGVALSDAAGYDTAALIELARVAADGAADSPDTSVVMTAPDGGLSAR